MLNHSFTAQARIVDESGTVLNVTETELVKVKTDFFSRIIAFFRMLFGKLPVIEQYNRDLAAWERQVNGENQPQQRQPEKESIRKKLRDMEAEAKRRNTERRQEPRHRSYDYDRGR